MISISIRMLVMMVVTFGTFAAGGFFLVGQASAADTSPHLSLIDRITAKFNLNKSDVESVFNDERSARQADMTARLETRLTAAVTAGKITENQKALILTKVDELNKDREATMAARKSMTPKERRADVIKRHDDLVAWEKANNIPSDMFFGGGFGRGGGMGWGRGMGHFAK